jgi:Nif-specific regulatory protein
MERSKAKADEGSGGFQGFPAIKKEIENLASELGKLKRGERELLPASSREKKTAEVLFNLARLEEGLARLEEKFSLLFKTYRKASEEEAARLAQAEQERDTFRALYDLAGVLAEQEELNSLLEKICDSILEITGSFRASILLAGEEGSLKTVLAKDRDKGATEEESGWLKLIAEDTLLTANPVLYSGWGDPETEKKWQFLSLPLKTRDKIEGVLFVENDGLKSPFDAGWVGLLSTLGEKIGQALERYRWVSQLEASQEKLVEDLRGKFKFDEILGNSPPMVEILKTVAQVADTDATVLITGESGTGKELLARALHYNSGRKKKPFVTINCAAIPETLLESELFGYEKGAFTGAFGKKPGKFEAAHGGTVFLDEIGETSPLIQVKLLRFLQSHEFEPLGSNQLKKSDVRVTAATNKNLEQTVREGRFREDLFYRLNVIRLNLPPLRERKEDIPLLAHSFLRRFAERSGKKVLGIDSFALTQLGRYDFPGNIRELENIIERSVLVARGENILIEDLPKLTPAESETTPAFRTAENYAELKKLREDARGMVEKSFLEKVMLKSEGNINRAARLAGMHHVELRRMLKRYGIKPKSPTQTVQQPASG